MQVIVPVTVRAGRDVAACAARLGALATCLLCAESGIESQEPVVKPVGLQPPVSAAQVAVCMP